MKFSIGINQKQALDIGITNITQAVIFDLLTGCSSWAKPEIIDGKVYYWVARQSIVAELPLLNIKPDTAYRHLKSLAEIGVIDYIKVGKKDCINITEKGKKYYVGNKSENDNPTMSENNPNNEQNSEINPNKLGNKSEFHSEINPTYQNTNTNQLNNINQEKKKKFILPDWVDKEIWGQWMQVRKAKNNVNTDLALNGLIKNLLICKEGGVDPNEAMTIAVQKSWAGLELKWILNLRANDSQKDTTLITRKPSKSFQEQNCLEAEFTRLHA